MSIDWNVYSKEIKEEIESSKKDIHAEEIEKVNE